MDEEMTPPAQRKKLKDMSEPERKQYNRERKAASRERACMTKTQNIRAEEYTPPDTWTNALNEFVCETDRTIRAELGSISVRDEYIVALLAECSMGLDKGYTMTVNEPYGVKAGHYIVDAAASELIGYTHRFPKILESHTFANLYQNFLKTVHKLSRNSWFDPKFAQEIQAELDGTYTLPPAPQIPRAPEPTSPEPTASR